MTGKGAIIVLLSGSSLDMTFVTVIRVLSFNVSFPRRSVSVAFASHSVAFFILDH